MRKFRFGILMVIALLAMVSVVSAELGVVTGTAQYTPNPNYWTVQINPGISELATGSYSGWCSDVNHVLYSVPYQFHVFSSLDPSGFTGPGADWEKVNYIINHKHSDWRITQAAIWHYDGWADFVLSHPGAGDYPYNGDIQPDTRVTGGYITGDGMTPPPANSYLKYIADIEAATENGYIPPCGGNAKYAIILYSEGLQVIFVEQDTQTCDPGIPVPEFPSLALPAGMMIGMIGLVYFIKDRK